ncbi:hypothetical protein F3Y22_tig00116958pilonHSYRG00105 [Hibiscus syriacus]|uniref:Reverse transcriptase domain-containing protein n=1 Tax=Hibiscus syriacus TaxID=106335 RepID=A0A6A2XP13_HIBSY|nr:hypothetical protein F3Y22_tig00116958pilonHSYRG00105 [Hibiscus syriacus]
MLVKAVNKGLFSGFELGSNDSSFMLSHLQFADDLIIFSKASSHDLVIIRRVLLIYELLVGLKLNLSKSRIFGINVGKEELVSWAKEIGCVKGVFPSEYLGLPLGAKRNSFSLWEPVVQKFYKSLAGWKAKSLSLAGRVVFWGNGCGNFLQRKILGGNLLRNLCVRAGNGETVKFWHVVWLGSVPLKDRFPRLFALSNNKEGKVAEFRLHNDAGWVWDIQTRKNLVDWEVEQWRQIISLWNNSSLSLVEEDCWIWLGNGEGCFTAKSCLKAFDRGVAVKEELLKRGVTGVEDSVCPMCRKYNESVAHLFLHCEVAWVLWAKNEVIFQKGKVDSALLFFITHQLGNPNKKNFPSSRWSPPKGFLKVNVDGALVKDWDKGGIGGLIRDGSGLVLGSFSEKVGGGPPLLAELLAINRGLILIEEVEVDFCPNQRIILESDSSNALKWINNLNLSTTLFQSLVTDITSTVERKGIITRHISRAANWEADELAKAGIG